MKKVFISFLIMTLMLTNISLVNISSVQAATTDNTVTKTDNNIKVSLKNIRDIMIDNSLEIKNLNNDMKIADEKYDYAKDAYEDAKDAYEAAKDALAADKDTSDTADADTTDAESKVTTTEKAVGTTKTTYDNAKETLKKAKDAYEKGVENKILTAQSNYLDYLDDLAQEQLQEDKVKTQGKETQVSKISYESGFMSKNKYITSNENNVDSTNELKAKKDAVELAKVKLCNTLGINSDDNIIFETDITEDFNVISKINFNSDLNEMFDNNSAIKLQKDAIDDLEDEEDNLVDEYGDDDIYDYTMNSDKNTLKIDTNNAETGFKTQYNTLMNSYNSIKSSYDKIIQEQTVYQITQTKFDYGFISKSDLDAAKLTFDTDMATFIKSRNACYLEYLEYIVMKEGY